MDDVTPQEVAAIDQVMAGMRDATATIAKLTTHLRIVERSAQELRDDWLRREEWKFNSIVAGF